jgi:hypothetical protein
MDCDELRDDQWERLKALVPGGAKASGVREQTTAGRDHAGGPPAWSALSCRAMMMDYVN